MSKIKKIRNLLLNGLYYLTEPALQEAEIDNFEIEDIEAGILNGKIRKSWPKQGKLEIVGTARDSRKIGIVCRITLGN